MRYSFIIPYFKRAEELWATFTSFRHWYGKRNDIEYIIIEDGANVDDEKAHDALVQVLYAFGDLNWVHLMSEHKNQFNPVLHRNYAASVAQGIVLIQTNPECYHKTNILRVLDKMFMATAKYAKSLPENFSENHPQWNVPSFQNKYKAATKHGSFEQYVICACECVEIGKKRAESYAELVDSEKHVQWYQHSKQNNRRLHWCSAISKDNYRMVQGFDENYAAFCGYDDDDFRETILHSKIPVLVRDDLVVAHVKHSTVHQADTMHLSRAGLEYFKRKWPKAGGVMYK